MKKLGLQETGSKYIHWFTGEDLHVWVYEEKLALYVKMGQDRLLVVWSKNHNTKQALYELYSLMLSIKSIWEAQGNVVFLPTDMFNVRLSAR